MTTVIIWAMLVKMIRTVTMRMKMVATMRMVTKMIKGN